MRMGAECYLRSAQQQLGGLAWVRNQDRQRVLRIKAVFDERWGKNHEGRGVPGSLARLP